MAEAKAREEGKMLLEEGAAATGVPKLNVCGLKEKGVLLLLPLLLLTGKGTAPNRG